MISHTNAIVDPWTMMVKSFNTFITDSAMPTSFSCYKLAYWTNSINVISKKSISIKFIVSSLEKSRINTA